MLSFIPIKPGTKQPAIRWEDNQKVAASAELVKNWTDAGLQLALVTGAVSGNLEVIDFDVEDCFKPWGKLIGQELFGLLTVVRTMKGYHVYYTCEEIGRNQVLAKQKIGGKAMIETRAEGGYVVTPSVNDNRYEFLEGSHATIPTLSLSERETLFEAARQLDERPKVYAGKNRVSGKPGDDYNEKAPPWEEILEPVGWELVRARADGVTEWRRPGKLDGISATVGMHGTDLFYIFSSSVDKLEPGTYSKFSYLAHTEFGGDYAACAKKLAKDGYGDQRQPKDFLAAKVNALAMTLDNFKGKDGNAYCFVEGRGVVALSSELYKGILTLMALDADVGEFISPAVIDNVANNMMRTVSACGEEREIHARVGYNEEERAVYVDMGEHNTRAVKITSDGWSIVDEPNVYFVTTQRRTPIPEPQTGGSLNDLRGLINAKTDDNYQMIVAWMLNCYNPHGAFPILVLHGDASTGKSEATRVIRSIIDPSRILSTLTKPNNVESIMQVAYSNYVLAYDNLSGISNMVSDALCQLSTGSGYATRKLYTNTELVVYDCQRPVILNGIDQLARREDFGTRALVLEFEKIQKGDKKSIEDMEQELLDKTPKFLGALFTAVSKSLANARHTQVDDFDTRLTDFCKWTVGAIDCFEWDREGFKNAIVRNAQAINEDLVAINPVSEYVDIFMQTREEWEGTSSDLLEKLTGLVTPAMSRSKDWPKTNATLSFKLTRAASSLSAIGIYVERFRTKTNRMIRIVNANLTDNE